jgi:hypothetical protein
LQHQNFETCKLKNVKSKQKTFFYPKNFSISMKKTFFFIFLSALMLITFSCNKMAQDEQPTPEKTQRNAKNGKTLNGNATRFLSSFYNGVSYSIGSQVSTSDNGSDLLVSEIIVSNEARGYLTTDKISGDPIYFADVDRTNYILKSVDVVRNEINTINNIDQNPEYASTDEFDFIKIVREITPEVQGRRRFWGTSTTCDPCVMGLITCFKQLYIFWFAIGDAEATDPQPC